MLLDFFWRVLTHQKSLVHHPCLPRLSSQKFSHISSTSSLANVVSLLSPLFLIQTMLLVSVVGVSKKISEELEI
ncbi:hypothetical protein A4A49_28005 [Nicotiana attenuata]|uniref:Uncharacterized protein n=1 Tax=Nicotiana attenuata TaxID=49451 RepID=A0A314KI51_NICAT|nr:hypothetical protein A4A49_28005 [Nicotiana attenuata]